MGLSHSTWRDEKSVVRWRTVAKHHETQQRGRDDVFQDYHLRVGEIVLDTAPPEGVPVVERRLDETEVGAANGLATRTDVEITQGFCAVWCHFCAVEFLPTLGHRSRIPFEPLKIGGFSLYGWEGLVTHEKTR